MGKIKDRNIRNVTIGPTDFRRKFKSTRHSHNNHAEKLFIPDAWAGHWTEAGWLGSTELSAALL